MIEPHGGRIVDLFVTPPGNLDSNLPSIHLGKRAQADFEMLATGCYSPLKGFMNRADYESTVADMRLSDGSVWTLPITLPVDREEREVLRRHPKAYLKSSRGDVVGKLSISDIFPYDKNREAEEVYGTTRDAHPGVRALFSQGDFYVAGEIEAYAIPEHERFREYRLSPSALREKFREKGWKRVVAFQTRNPIHRAHEYITKCALELVDGLLLHPIVGETSPDDIPAEVRMKCYEAILENYFPHRHTILAVYPAFMRYAGPREDRDKNIARVTFVAELLVNHGIIVPCAFISPYRKERRYARQEIGEFVEVFVKCPLEVCEARDVKGLYSKARRGEIKHFTGIDDPYEEPRNAEITVDTSVMTLREEVDTIVDFLQDHAYIT